MLEKRKERADTARGNCRHDSEKTALAGRFLKTIVNAIAGKGGSSEKSPGTREVKTSESDHRSPLVHLAAGEAKRAGSESTPEAAVSTSSNPARSAPAPVEPQASKSPESSVATSSSDASAGSTSSREKQPISEDHMPGTDAATLSHNATEVPLPDASRPAPGTAVSSVLPSASSNSISHDTSQNQAPKGTSTACHLSQKGGEEQEDDGTNTRSADMVTTAEKPKPSRIILCLPLISAGGGHLLPHEVLSASVRFKFFKEFLL